MGVARQYCGVLGKQDNCQVAVSVSLACEAASVPVAWQLYVPREWADDEFWAATGAAPEQFTDLGWGEFLLDNLVPVTIEGMEACRGLFGERELAPDAWGTV